MFKTYTLIDLVNFSNILTGFGQENLISTIFCSGTISIKRFSKKNYEKKIKQIGLGAFSMFGQNANQLFPCMYM